MVLSVNKEAHSQLDAQEDTSVVVTKITSTKRVVAYHVEEVHSQLLKIMNCARNAPRVTYALVQPT
jgi:hypothetical protein